MIPRIMGQAPEYLEQALQTFASYPDVGSANVGAMTIIASRLSAEEIDALAAYLANQPWGGSP